VNLSSNDIAQIAILMVSLCFLLFVLVVAYIWFECLAIPWNGPKYPEPTRRKSDWFDGSNVPIKEPDYSEDYFKPIRPYPPLVNVETFLISTKTKLSEIFVALNVFDEKPDSKPVIKATSSYSEKATETENIRLVRSGTGFLVYNHPNFPAGKWVSCR
jgi:hypothetical protein